jgi:hypothetical protein
MHNSLLRKARMEVIAHGRILMDTATRLMAVGYDVPKIEQRLLMNQECAA